MVSRLLRICPVCFAISSDLTSYCCFILEIPGVFGIGAIGGTHPIQGSGKKNQE